MRKRSETGPLHLTVHLLTMGHELEDPFLALVQIPIHLATRLELRPQPRNGFKQATLLQPPDRSGRHTQLLGEFLLRVSQLRRFRRGYGDWRGRNNSWSGCVQSVRNEYH